MQKAARQVQVRVRLVDARTDRQVWAIDYGRILTAENIFEIQSEITKRVADALEAQSSPKERAGGILHEGLSLYHLGRNRGATAVLEDLSVARRGWYSYETGYNIVVCSYNHPSGDPRWPSACTAVLGRMRVECDPGPIP